jgi:hypothetical protein
VGAENLCHLGKGSAEHGWAFGMRRAGLGPAGGGVVFGLRGLKLVFLIVSGVVSVLGLSRRESWWKDAEILMLRHQLAVAGGERPGARARLTWLDRVLPALLAGTLPIGRLAAVRLILTRDHLALAP